MKIGLEATKAQPKREYASDILGRRAISFKDIVYAALVRRHTMDASKYKIIIF